MTSAQAGDRTRWPAAVLAGIYACLVVAHFRAFFPRFRTHLIGDHGDVLLQHLHCAWQWVALVEGRFAELLKLPTFHPYDTGFAFGETLIGVSLPFAPLYLFTGSTPATYNTAVVASFLLLGLATFLWVRELFDEPAAGLLAAVLVVFVPWRLQLITNLNNLTVHYAVLGAWLLTVWSRSPRLGILLAAVLCFHLQLITSAQVAVVAIYLTVFWFAVVWASRRFALERRVAGQLGVATALFLLLAWPWWDFFSEGFAASRGLPRTREMLMWSSDFGRMAEQFGAIGPLGAIAAASLPALILAARAGRLRPGVGAHVAGLCIAAALLLVCARGPYWNPETQLVNPGYTLTRLLPFLAFYRAPVRLAAFTPVVLALLAGGGFAVLIASVRTRDARWRAAWACVPLLAVPLWPALDPAMGAPIAQRPADLALAEALSELPEDAVILPLPLDLEPSGGAVDERVLIHRRSQVGGFASIIPPVFRSALHALGQWPESGHELVRALGVTHVVAPERWVDEHAGTLETAGYGSVARRGGRAIVAAPPAAEAQATTHSEVRVPTAAAADRWLTLAVAQTPPRFHPAGHLVLDASWRGAGGRVTRVEALALLPGVVSKTKPILVHVPTPKQTGAATLEITSDLFTLSAEIQIEARPTSFDAGPRRVTIALAAGWTPPVSVRAGGAFPVDVELSAEDAPIMLATSRVDLPFRRGETQVLARYRSAALTSTQGGPGLSADLVPGKPRIERWHLGTPPRAGLYDLEVSLLSLGVPAPPSDWVPLLSGLRVVAE